MLMTTVMHLDLGDMPEISVRDRGGRQLELDLGPLSIYGRPEQLAVIRDAITVALDARAGYADLDHGDHERDLGPEDVE